MAKFWPGIVFLTLHIPLAPLVRNVQLAGLALVAATIGLGVLRATSRNPLTAVYVAAGGSVEAGQSLLVVEAMKMEHTIVAPAGGVVAELRVSVGDTVDQGQLLVRIEAADASEP